MTRDEILSMPAGLEMNAIVATHVMGAPEIIWEKWRDGERYPVIRYCPGDDVFHPVPSYSTDIAAAWQVMERLRCDWSEIHLTYTPRGWYVLLADSFTGKKVTETGRQDSAPFAICRAALLATL